MERNEQQWADLCRQVKDLVPREFGREAWYLLIVRISCLSLKKRSLLTFHRLQAAALGVSPVPSAPAGFYTYLTKHESAFSSENSKEHLSQRLRDVMLKLLTIVGGPQVLSVLIPLAAAEGDIKSRAASSELSEKWFDTLIAPCLFDRIRSANKLLF